MTTGERIKAAREAAGMTQAELAKQLGISYVGVSQWERGIRNPKYSTLKKIADILGVWVYDLSSPEDTMERIKMLYTEDGSSEYDYSIEENGGRITLVTLFGKLNRVGQMKAIERIQELTELPRYQRKPPAEDEILVEDEEE